MRSASSNSTRMGGKAQADGGYAGAAERAQFPAAGAERVSSRIDARARRGPVFHPSGSSPHLPFRLPTRVPNRPPPFNDRLLALFFSDENRPERPRAPRRGESGETREPRSGPARPPRLSVRSDSHGGLAPGLSGLPPPAPMRVELLDALHMCMRPLLVSSQGHPYMM